jgi:hypothetical protein
MGETASLGNNYDSAMYYNVVALEKYGTTPKYGIALFGQSRIFGQSRKGNPVFWGNPVRTIPYFGIVNDNSRNNRRSRSSSSSSNNNNSNKTRTNGGKRTTDCRIPWQVKKVQCSGRCYFGRVERRGL